MTMQEEEVVKTLVWWNISSCPIPTGLDPRQVRPRIVSALKNSGVSGPVIMTAIGRLTHNPNAPDDDVLRELSSTGIALIYSKELQTNLFKWMEKNPPPANIMLISGPKELDSLARTLYLLENEGYKILLAYPQRHPAPDWLWDSFLSGVYKEWLWTNLLMDDMDSGSKHETKRLALQDKCSETGESPWSCSICFFEAQSFEDFTTHIKSEEHARFVLDLVTIADVIKRNQLKPLDYSVFVALEHNPEMVDTVKLHQLQQVEVEEEEEKTLVWWDISSCPIPLGYDPCQVCPRIVSALRNYPVSGPNPITITAIGRLTHHPNAPDNDVLRKLSSSGISLIHAKELEKDLFAWTKRNPPPAKILLISGTEELESLARTLYSLDMDGYTFFLAYPQQRPGPAWLWKRFLLGVYKEWLWTSLLEDEMSSLNADKDKCSQTGESVTWSCTVCAYAALSFEDFTTHLKSKEHAQVLQ